MEPMNRPHDAVLSRDEIEALKKAFDDNPPPSALQPRFRFTHALRLTLFAAGFHLVSFNITEPVDPPIVMAERSIDVQRVWHPFDQFPLVIAEVRLAPIPDFIETPLMLMTPLFSGATAATGMYATQIRNGDSPQNTETTQQQSSTKAVSPATSKDPAPASSSPSPKVANVLRDTLQTIAKAAANPLTASQPNPVVATMRDRINDIKSDMGRSGAIRSGGSLAGFRKN